MKKSNLIVSAALAGLIAGTSSSALAHSDHKAHGQEKRAEKNKCKGEMGEKNKCKGEKAKAKNKRAKKKKAKEMACGENGCNGH